MYLLGAVDTNLTTINTDLSGSITDADTGVLANVGAFGGLMAVIAGASIAVIVIRKMLKKAYSPAKRV